tara:strand:- start:45 stop:737 length:693 start_codon:yes stop_codon:yes gene_type:complete
MQSLMEGWREYVSDQEEASLLVEQIWSGSLVNEIVLLEHQQTMLEEGIGTFFSSAFGAVKGKIEDFADWKDQKLMAFINNSIKKIQDFFNSMREIARKTANKTLLKLFPKYGTRKITDAFEVFRRPEYLKAGAAILSVVLQKLAELGAQAVLDAMTSGAATAVKIAEFVQKNVQKIKMFVEAVKAALNPNGIVGILGQITFFKETADLLLNLKKDLENPHREFVQGFKIA